MDEPLMFSSLWYDCARIIADARSIPVDHVGPRMVRVLVDAVSKIEWTPPNPTPCPECGWGGHNWHPIGCPRGSDGR